MGSHLNYSYSLFKPFLISSIIVSFGLAMFVRADHQVLEVVLSLSLIAFILCLVLGISLKRPKGFIFRLLIGGGVTLLIHLSPLIIFLVMDFPPQD